MNSLAICGGSGPHKRVDINQIPTIQKLHCIKIKMWHFIEIARLRITRDMTETVSEFQSESLSSVIANRFTKHSLHIVRKPRLHTPIREHQVDHVSFGNSERSMLSKAVPKHSDVFVFACTQINFVRLFH